MALLKSKVGNTTYSWKSDDIRDGEIKAITEVYSGKNLLQNNGTSGTDSGVTFTVNANGSVTINGTASNITWFNLSNQDFGTETINTWDHPQGNDYIISNGGDVGAPHMQYEGNTKKTYIVISNGASFNNVTVYPMIRDVRITDPTYVPYSMTNRELTERICRYIDISVTFNSDNMVYIYDDSHPYNCVPVAAIDIGGDWDIYAVGYNTIRRVWLIKNLVTSTGQTRTVRIYYTNI